MGRRTRNVLRFIGLCYLCIVGAIILAGYAGIWWFDGFWALTDIVSPFNVVGWLTVLVTLAPGFLFLHFGQKRISQAEADKITVTAIAAARYLGAKSAREAAEMTMGRALTDEEWSLYGEAWIRTWDRLSGTDTEQSPSGIQ